MAKAYLKLQPSEASVFAAASRIYSAYINSGRVEEGSEKKWMQQAIREAIQMANATDDAIISDGEVE